MAQSSGARREVSSLTDPIMVRVTRARSTRPWMDRWMGLLRTIGNIQAWLLLSLFYVLIVSPMGLLLKRLGDPPLRLRRSASTWQPLARQYDQVEQAQEQS